MTAPYVRDPDFTLWNGDCLEVLQGMAAGSVDCCVTSPPYWGLRDYGTGRWDGGSEDCDHAVRTDSTREKQLASTTLGGGTKTVGHQREGYKSECARCGAVRVDGQLGLEATPAEYVARMVAVFREVRRVLSDTGTCWLNLGDTYASDTKGDNRTPEQLGRSDGLNRAKDSTKAAPFLAKVSGTRKVSHGLKTKDLCGIPWRVAFALQEPYYNGRIKDERDRLWLAAMVDTEGSIGINFQRGGTHRRNDVYSVSVNVHNCSEALIRRCAELAGVGTVALAEERRRPVFVWSVYGANARGLLRELYPHFVAKQHEARLAYAHEAGVGGDAKARYESLRLLHAGSEATVDAPDPPSCLEPGWYLRSDIIWSKPNPMPESVTDRPTKSHEYVFLLSKSPRYFYDAAAVAEPAQWERWGDQTVPKHNGTATAVGWIKPKPKQELTGESGFERKTKNSRSVWEIATQPFPEAHFACFPEELPRRCIAAGCPHDGTVLDPFGGSGTTALVARKLGRRSVLIELNETYCEMAARRLGQQSLLAVEPE